jgi:GNAT superfamily N-acetyltransferase
VLEIRRCADTDEKARWLAIYNEVVPEHAVALEDVERWESAHVASVDFLGLLDDEPAGSASAAISHARPAAARTFLTVLPARRRRGLGSALYGAVSAWAAEHGASELLARIREGEPESLAFAERRGYRVIARDSNLVLDLTGLEPLPVDPPAGVEIVRWADRPELARGLHEATFEANPDVPGSEDWAGEPFDAWERLHRPELMFVAVTGDDVVGFAELLATEARPGVAVHMMTGVRRAWRRRGIAGALKRAQIAWAKAAGYERLETANELRNEPIRRLNERLGYREGPGRVEVRGPLAASDVP